MGAQVRAGPVVWVAQGKLISSDTADGLLTQHLDDAQSWHHFVADHLAVVRDHYGARTVGPVADRGFLSLMV